MLSQLQARARGQAPRILPPTSPGSSPISKLPQDILLRIFQINANMNGDALLQGPLDRAVKKRDASRAIHTTRISSHVSFLWRDIIVKAPLLWANLIDFDVLEVAGDLWREEVFRRTQHSALHVKGHITLGSINLTSPNMSQILLFLDNNWGRIRVFDVVIIDHGEAMFAAKQRLFQLMNPGQILEFKACQAVLPFLSRATTTLESFRLRLPVPCSPINADVALFDNSAPRLKSFDISNWPGCLTKQRYDWLPQIQNLNVLKYCNNTVTSMDVFHEILSMLPRLRSLYLSNVVANPFIAPHRTPVQLPLLDRIEILSTDSVSLSMAAESLPTVCWQILDFIVPKSGCSISLRISNLLMEDVPQAASILTRYARNYLDFHCPTTLTLSSSPNRLSMSTNSQPTHPTHNALGTVIDRPSDGMPFLDFGIDLKDSTDERIYHTFQALFSLSHPYVTDLTLDIGLGHREAFADVHFRTMLSSFSSVRKMTMTALTLHFLVTSPVIDVKTVFPRLKYVNIPQKDGRDLEMASLGVCPQELCAMFRDLRKAAGVPLYIDLD